MKNIIYYFMLYVCGIWGFIHWCPLSHTEDGENMRNRDKSEMTPRFLIWLTEQSIIPRTRNGIQEVEEGNIIDLIFVKVD